MVKWLLKKIVGTKHQRELKRMWPVVQKINKIEEGLQSLSEDELREKTRGWQADLKAMETKVDDEVEAWKQTQLASLAEDDQQAHRDLEEQARRRKAEQMGAVHDEQAEFLDELLPEAFAVVKNGARVHI